MSDKKNLPIVSAKELQNACEQFDEALRAFARNPMVSRNLAHEVIDGDCYVSLSALRNIAEGEELLLDYRKEALPRGYFDRTESIYLEPVLNKEW